MTQEKVVVVADPNGWRLVIYVRKYRFESDTLFARKRDAVKAAMRIAQDIGAQYVPPSEPPCADGYRRR
jgi:DhnA family fructose-bisphosphate aldolase class Ia